MSLWTGGLRKETAVLCVQLASPCWSFGLSPARASTRPQARYWSELKRRKPSIREDLIGGMKSTLNLKRKGWTGKATATGGKHSADARGKFWQPNSLDWKQNKTQKQVFFLFCFFFFFFWRGCQSPRNNWWKRGRRRRGRGAKAHRTP